MKQQNKKSSIEIILSYIGITHDNVRVDAYNHWRRFIDFAENIREKIGDMTLDQNLEVG